MKPRLTILCHDVSKNALGRAHIFYDLLHEDFDIEIAGPSSTGRIWEPLREENMKIKVIDGRTWPEKVINICKAIKGKTVLCVKPLFYSFIPALLKAAFCGTKLILDIDDYEKGFIREIFREKPLLGKLRYLLYSLFRFPSPEAFFSVMALDLAARAVKYKTVSGLALKSIYGGTVIRHIKYLPPVPPGKKEEIRKSLGLVHGGKLVMFLGTPRPHKGLKTLFRAMEDMPSDTVLLVAGASENEDQFRMQEKKLEEKIGKRYIRLGFTPLSALGGYLSACDVFVIPQLSTPSSFGQVPAKLFDAMAAGCAIAASDAGEIPLILGAAGKTYPSGDAGALKELLTALLSSDDARGRLKSLAAAAFAKVLEEQRSSAAQLKKMLL